MSSRTASPFGSTIGLKVVMALSGLGLLLFVIAHMLGNLQVFAGPERLNHYAQSLQNLGPILWLMRAGLLALFVLHVASAWRLWRLNRGARPVPYVSVEPQVTSIAARTMIWSGFVVAAFVVYHLLHFTFGATHPLHHEMRRDGLKDVYGMVVLGFREWPVAVSYVVAQAVLCLHLAHGASSAFQTLGVTHPRFLWLRTWFGNAVAVVIFVGNVSIPVACLAGFVTWPAGGR